MMLIVPPIAIVGVREGSLQENADGARRDHEGRRGKNWEHQNGAGVCERGCRGQEVRDARRQRLPAGLEGGILSQSHRPSSRHSFIPVPSLISRFPSMTLRRYWPLAS